MTKKTYLPVTDESVNLFIVDEHGQLNDVQKTKGHATSHHPEPIIRTRPDVPLINSPDFGKWLADYHAKHNGQH